MWDYKNADVSSMGKALDLVNWEKLFRNENIDIQVSIFNETILNILSNFIPNKIIGCNDKDPTYMSEQLNLK